VTATSTRLTARAGRQGAPPVAAPWRAAAPGGALVDKELAMTVLDAAGGALAGRSGR
jgi:hypothetical protein